MDSHISLTAGTFQPLPLERKRSRSTSDEVTSPSTEDIPETKKLKASVTEIMTDMEYLTTEDTAPSWSDLAFDAIIIKSDQEYNQLIDYCMAECPGTPISLIRHPKDFDNDGLTTQVQVTCTPEGASVEQELPGTLYGDQPVILLVDGRMDAANLAELNELMETPPKFRGKPLGKGCKVITLLSEDMLPKKNKSNKGKPREDFWRRVSRSTNSWQLPAPKDYYNKPEALESVPLHWKGDGTRTTILDFQHEPDWRKVLFGEYALNEHGKAIYKHSGIYELLNNDISDQPSPATVVLKAAPWHDRAFTLAFKQLVANGRYIANGEEVPVNFLTFVTQAEDSQHHKTLLKAVKFSNTPSARAFCINSANIEDCLSEAAIIDNSIQPHDLLADILEHHDGLRISSKLTSAQWIRLLTRINAFHDQNKPLSLFMDTPLAQPAEFQGPAQRVQGQPPSSTQRIKIVQSSDDELISRFTSHITSQVWSDSPEGIFHLSLTPELELPQITSELQVISLNNRHFDNKSTPLLDALESGKPVFVRNLHQNPVLQQQLETLLQTPPCLIIDGQRRAFPNANILVLLPDLKDLTSPVWKSISRNMITTEDANLYFHVQLFHQYTLTDIDQHHISHLDMFLKHMSSIPSSPRKLWPFPHPSPSLELYEKVIRQARMEQAAAGYKTGESIKPEHWRRAINLVLLDEYKGHTEVHAYLECACLDLFADDRKERKFTVDTTVLKQFLEDHQNPDKSTVYEHFWTLFRAFSPDCIPQQTMSRYNNKHPESLKLLYRSLISICPENRKASLSKALETEPGPGPIPAHSYPSVKRQISEAFSALRWNAHKSNEMEHDQTMAVTTPSEARIEQAASDIGKILDSDRSVADKALEVSNHITSLGLPKAESTVLSQCLAENRTNWQYWQDSRNQQLAELLSHQKVVFLKGEAGAGKTYTAVQVARKLNPNTPPFTVTVGPQADQASLLKNTVSLPAPVSMAVTRLLEAGFSPEQISLLRNHSTEANRESDGITLTLTRDVKKVLKEQLEPAVFSKVLDHFTDTRTEVKEGPVMEWAKCQPPTGTDGMPITLVIDEANLANPDLWNIFQGMSAKQPYISCGGEVIPLTDQHRVIFTGNPETAAGRKVSLQLRSRVCTLYYPALPEEFLIESVLAPRLDAMETLTPEQKKQCQNNIMTLWNQFHILLPEHEFTPRDLHEISDRLDLYLTAEEQLSVSDTIHHSDERLAALVWLAVNETLGGDCDPTLNQLESLALWFSEKQGLSSHDYTAIDQQFDAFYVNLSARRDFAFGGQSQRELGRTIWMALKKCETELNLQTTLQGKHATLIEGPPGRGKDALLGNVLSAFSRQSPETQKITAPVHLNAGRCDWEEIKQAIQTAAREGKIIIISELNLLPSQFLEGELNDVITGEAQPGFHLFATVNPTEFSGRETFSPALQSRFVRQRIDDYSDSELEQVAITCLPHKPDIAQTITHWHCALRNRLAQSNSAGLRPSASDLTSLLKHIGGLSRVSPPQIAALFGNQYKIFLKSAEVELSELIDQNSDSTAALASEKRQQRINREFILRKLYHRFPEIPPLTLTKGLSGHYQPQTGVLTVESSALTANTEDQLNNAVNRISMTMIIGLWEAAGLPLNFPARKDSLSCGLMTKWQRAFAANLLSQTITDAALINRLVENQFPLTDMEKSSLLRKENQPYVHAITELLSEHHFQADTTLFNRFAQLLAQPVSELVSKPDAHKLNEPMEITQGSVAASQFTRHTTDLLPAIQTPNFTSIALSTNIQGLGGTYLTERIFEKFKPKENRSTIILTEFDGNGSVILTRNRFGISGFNDVTVESYHPDKVLTISQEVGRQTLLLGDGEWHPLCGLTSFPQSSLAAIEVTPACGLEVVLDRELGLYLIRIAQHDREKQTWQTNQPFSVDMILETSTHPPIYSGAKQLSIIRRPCPLLLQSVISNHQDANVKELVRKLKNNAAEPQKQVDLIKGFCKTFEDEGEFQYSDSYDFLNKMLTRGPASPSSRSTAFWMLASWCGLPTRRVCGISGESVSDEVSVDGGFSWSTIDLGGKVKNPDRPQETDKTFPENPEEQAPNLSHWARGLVYNDPVTPDKAAHYMSTIKPGSKNYLDFCRIAAKIIPQTISVSGAVSVAKTKEWLDEFYRNSVSERIKTALPELLNNLKKRATKEGSDELQGIYEELSDYILIEQEWLTTGEYNDGLHHLARTRPRAITRQRKAFYNNALTHELTFGKDIRRPLSTDESSEISKMDPQVLETVQTLLEGCTSSTLLNTLYGELPDVSYRATPPGSIKAERMIRRLPCFRSSSSTPSLRPGLVVSPALEYDKLLQKRFLGEIQIPGQTKLHYSDKSKSQELVNFYLPYIRQAYLSYLYKIAGGEKGALKVLFPIARSESFPEDLKKPYRPEKIGWITPESPEEFNELASVSSTHFNPADNQLLREDWASEGFNESALCLLTGDTMEACLESYLDTIDWQALLSELDKIPQWQQKLEGMNKKMKEKHLNDQNYAIAEIKAYQQEGMQIPEHLLREIREPKMIDDLIIRTPPES